jgi:hypothetical protein
MKSDRSRTDSKNRADAELARKMALLENGPTTTNFEQLVAKGITLEPPESLADSVLQRQLWEVIHSLSEMRVYLSETDHLSDRDLYAKLWHQMLREEVPAIDEIGFDHHVGLLSDGGAAETTSYLRYYADTRWREGWLQQFPDAVVPPHEDPPFDRDRLLPQPSSAPGFTRRWRAAPRIVRTDRGCRQARRRRGASDRLRPESRATVVGLAEATTVS